MKKSMEQNKSDAVFYSIQNSPIFSLITIGTVNFLDILSLKLKPNTSRSIFQYVYHFVTIKGAVRPILQILSKLYERKDVKILKRTFGGV